MCPTLSPLVGPEMYSKVIHLDSLNYHDLPGEVDQKSVSSSCVLKLILDHQFQLF